MNPDHSDTQFPTVPLSPTGEKEYSILRYELSQISGQCVISEVCRSDTRVLEMTMKVKRPPYDTVMDLHYKL